MRQGYTQIWMRKELGRVRGEEKPLPRSTFYRWVDKLGLTPTRWYQQSDLDLLKDFCLHLLMGGTVQEYLDELLEQADAQPTSDPQRTRTERQQGANRRAS